MNGRGLVFCSFLVDWLMDWFLMDWFTKIGLILISFNYQLMKCIEMNLIKGCE